MSRGRAALLAVAFAGITAAATFVLLRPAEEAKATSSSTLTTPHAPALDAAQVATGRLAMERLPVEVGSALEKHSEEIVRNAEAIERKQSRITGACAPGSAIRLVAEDGSVRCQAFPRGVVSVSALTAAPRLSSTLTEAGNVRGGSGRYQTSGPDDYLVAPVQLPDGAIVTSFSYTFLDADPGADTEAFLYRSDDEPLASISSKGAADHVRTAATDQMVLRKIDTSRYAYFVYFQVSSSAASRLMPISASVTYHLP